MTFTSLDVDEGYWNKSGTPNKERTISHIRYEQKPLCNHNLNISGLFFIMTGVCVMHPDEVCNTCLTIYNTKIDKKLVMRKRFPELRLGI